MNDIIKLSEYRDWLRDLKQQIKIGQIKAALSVNSQMIMLYWDLGRQITEKQEKAKWGSGFIEQLSKDLIEEFPEMKGFSFTNLHYCRRFFKFYSRKTEDNKIIIPILPQVEGKLQIDNNEYDIILPQDEGNLKQTVSLMFSIPWGHQKLLIDKCKTIEQALFYINKTVENNWSRAVLEYQIEMLCDY